LGAVVSAGLRLRDCIGGRTAKVLEIGAAILFGGLALYALLGRPAWSVIGVRLAVDTGLLVIVLASIVMGRPFTLQYAREQVAPEHWDTPEFVRANYVVAAELALLTLPGMSPRIGIVAIVLALIGAVKFTRWYPDRVKARTAR
jgi:hypothetical protein